MGVSKNRGKTPKLNGEYNGKPYEQMDDLGGKTTTIVGNTHIYIYVYIYIYASYGVSIIPTALQEKTDLRTFLQAKVEALIF